jgi:hypothetical protein
MQTIRRFDFLIAVALVFLLVAGSACQSGQGQQGEAAKSKALPKTAIVSGGEGSISPAVTLWSKAGGIQAQGSSLKGTISGNSEVELLDLQDFQGKKFYLVRGTGAESNKEGWVEDRFVKLPSP